MHVKTRIALGRLLDIPQLLQADFGGGFRYLEPVRDLLHDLYVFAVHRAGKVAPAAFIDRLVSNLAKRREGHQQGGGKGVGLPFDPLFIGLLACVYPLDVGGAAGDIRQALRPERVLLVGGRIVGAVQHPMGALVGDCEPPARPVLEPTQPGVDQDRPGFQVYRGGAVHLVTAGNALDVLERRQAEDAVAEPQRFVQYGQEQPFLREGVDIHGPRVLQRVGRVFPEEHRRDIVHLVPVQEKHPVRLLAVVQFHAAFALLWPFLSVHIVDEFLPFRIRDIQVPGFAQCDAGNRPPAEVRRQVGEIPVAAFACQIVEAVDILACNPQRLHHFRQMLFRRVAISFFDVAQIGRRHIQLGGKAAD